ncbi:hypothetical protein [Burkholderia ubonensis]|uniref:hypothetical protein n=1 Tax=Burkholderia ubonensis TaxID=101571 RepID=UPI0012FBDEF7|nr:hypothetical protein [Burkholderia ubonensis]
MPAKAESACFRVAHQSITTTTATSYTNAFVHPSAGIVGRLANRVTHALDSPVERRHPRRDTCRRLRSHNQIRNQHCASQHSRQILDMRDWRRTISFSWPFWREAHELAEAAYPQAQAQAGQPGHTVP